MGFSFLTVSAAPPGFYFLALVPHGWHRGLLADATQWLENAVCWPMPQRLRWAAVVSSVKMHFPATEWRQPVAHGASRGVPAPKNKSPEERQKLSKGRIPLWFNISTDR